MAPMRHDMSFTSFWLVAANHNTTFLLSSQDIAKIQSPKCSISRGEYEDRVTIASTASEYPLADFRFRGTPAPKHKNCLLG